MIQAQTSSFSSENGLNCITFFEIQSKYTDLEISHFIIGEPLRKWFWVVYIYFVFLREWFT